MLPTPSGGLTCQLADHRKTSVIITVKITELDPATNRVIDTHNHHQRRSCFRFSQELEDTTGAMHMGECEVLSQRRKSDLATDLGKQDVVV